MTLTPMRTMQSSMQMRQRARRARLRPLRAQRPRMKTAAAVVMAAGHPGAKAYRISSDVASGAGMGRCRRTWSSLRRRSGMRRAMHKGHF